MLAAALAAGAPHSSGQTGSTPPPLTLLSRDGRRPIAVTPIGDQDFVALDDLAAIFQLAVREDSLGALTVSYKGKTIVLTSDQALASVSGKLISLPAPPSRIAAPGRPPRWLVPVDFIARALAPIYDSRIDLRKPSHLLIVGDVRVPRVAVRYDLQGTGARLTVDATPRTLTTVAQENDHLSIKFDADALDIVLPAIQGQGLVQSVRLVDPVGLAVDLGPRFASFRASSQALDVASRLTIDLIAAQTDAAPTPTPAPPSVTPAPPPPPQDLTASQQGPSIRTMAIDAGHGGDDQGVAGPNGTKEKDLTLAIARRLKSAIETRLGIRVLMTRDDDRNVPIDERTATANHNKADLFVSVHANASLRSGSTGGSVYYAAFDKDADDAARTSLGTERLPTFAGGTREIELVLWDLAQTRYVDRSAVFARLLEQQLRGHVPLASHPVDRAPLRVLESANMPAILFEVGYLSNADQERQLTGGEMQNTIVNAIVNAVLRFRESIGGTT